MFKAKRWEVSLSILTARVLMINFNVILEGLIMEERAGERQRAGKIGEKREDRGRWKEY